MPSRAGLVCHYTGQGPVFDVLTLGEILKGVEKLADTQRRKKLRMTIEIRLHAIH